MLHFRYKFVQQSRIRNAGAQGSSLQKNVFTFVLCLSNLISLSGLCTTWRIGLELYKRCCIQNISGFFFQKRKLRFLKYCLINGQECFIGYKTRLKKTNLLIR